jgi:hypothetical protein
MSIEVDEHFIRRYTSGIMHLAEQKESRLRNAVRVEPVSAEKTFFDQVGSQVLNKRTTRHGDTILTDTPHRRRMVTTATYDGADLVDEPDVLRVLNDPTNAYSVSFSRAAGRQMDDVIIASAFAVANTGKEGDDPVSFVTPDFVVAHNAEGLTVAKVIEAKEILDAAENDPMEQRYAVVSAKQITDMLGTTEITSSDFNSVKALVQGEIDTWMGFKWIRSERLDLPANGRSCIFYQKNSLLLGVGTNAHVRIAERPDKNHSTQVFITMDFGATRMDETGVVLVECAE